MSELNPSLPPPPTPATGVSQGVKFNLWEFLNSLGNDAKTRRHPSLNQALSGIAGALIAFGWIALLAGDSDSNAGAYVGAIVAFGGLGYQQNRYRHQCKRCGGIDGTG